MPCLDVAYINPYIDATRQVFATMVKVPLAMGKPWLRGGDRLDKVYQVSVLVGMQGAARGMLALSLSQPVAIALASAFSPNPIKTVNRDCLDALGEITNMIAGQAKQHLPTGQITLSVPRIVSTRRLPYPSDIPVMLIPFDTATGRFLIQVAVDSDSQYRQAA